MSCLLFCWDVRVYKCLELFQLSFSSGVSCSSTVPRVTQQALLSLTAGALPVNPDLTPCVNLPVTSGTVSVERSMGLDQVLEVAGGSFIERHTKDYHVVRDRRLLIRIDQIVSSTW